ncbi:MAG: hypothetical protein OXU27_18735 [Candidatus Poribacteria bacterium]|nr:hypothetical protein [Candidatus Poribacteria bacterium]
MNSTLTFIKLQLILIIVPMLFTLGCERQVAKEIIMIGPPDIDDNRNISDLPIDDIQIIRAPNLPNDEVVNDFFVVVNGWFPNPCNYAHNETEVIRSQDGKEITIKISMKRFPSSPWLTCMTATEPYQQPIDLGILPPGNYRVVVNGIGKSFTVVGLTQ